MGLSVTLIGILDPSWLSSAGAIALVLLLLVGSALISASEVALFSLTPAQRESLLSAEDSRSRNILKLLEEPDRSSAPRRLLATILIANNAINIAFVLVSSGLTTSWFAGLDAEPWVKVLTEIAVITFVILMFGEIIPKVYASGHNLAVARFMAVPLIAIQSALSPVSWMLLGIGRIISRWMGTPDAGNISVDDLGHALELTADENRSQGEHRILEGIVTFGEKEVGQIMTPRMDIGALNIQEPYPEVLATITEKGYSRWPVYGKSMDEITGFLFVKDLLPYLDDAGFAWQQLVRPAFFVPEHKKIDDLLQEFQQQKIHLAIVVDEYGGTSGLVTLEDILEEIVGDISDEFDDEDTRYSRLDDSTYLVEGKISLVDLYKILDIDGDPFEKARGDSSTLAGFVIEQAGAIPEKGAVIRFGGFTFTIESSDKRRIKRIKITLPQAV
ncbi:MAG: gliding motility-associated protein GldE [Flavobacteriales bacterium]|jgi:gliding motility-associated protein GldE